MEDIVQCDICGCDDHEDEMEIHYGCYVCVQCSFDQDNIREVLWDDGECK